MWEDCGCSDSKPRLRRRLRSGICTLQSTASQDWTHPKEQLPALLFAIATPTPRPTLAATPIGKHGQKPRRAQPGLSQLTVAPILTITNIRFASMAQAGTKIPYPPRCTRHFPGAHGMRLSRSCQDRTHALKGRLQSQAELRRTSVGCLCFDVTGLMEKWDFPGVLVRCCFPPQASRHPVGWLHIKRGDVLTAKQAALSLKTLKHSLASSSIYHNPITAPIQSRILTLPLHFTYLAATQHQP